MAKINAWGTRQVVEALDHLDETQQQTVATGLAAYARALAQCVGIARSRIRLRKFR
ncbi:hypothetical protein MJ699_16520 [Klebsiella pneumoniae]|nr:hypothetical protein MJ699_16520 [Klebsiella pneumoniae]